MPLQRRSDASRRRVRGVTLVELMIALAVGAILLAIAVPSFKRLMSKTDATQTANDLVGDFATARNLAATRQLRTCLVSVGGDWMKGWQVKVDSNGDGDCSDTADEVVREHGALADGFALSADRGGTALTQLDYSPDGSVSGAAADSDFKVCREADSQAQRVVVKVRASGVAAAYRDDSASGPTC
ncbi:MAG: GspH/FimT family pseudopilin [Rhodanobacteraceae bacterium]